MEDRLRKILNDIAGRNIEGLNRETDLLDEVQLGSVQVVDLMLVIEREFGLQFTEFELDMSNFRTFGALLKLLISKTDQDDGYP